MREVEHSAQAHTAILDGRLAAESVARASTIRTIIIIYLHHYQRLSPQC